jgi:hypothetical protein
MRFVLEVDLTGFPEGEAGRELSRILRYWAGAVGKMDLQAGQGTAIYDSAYREVGFWSINDEPAAEPPA